MFFQCNNNKISSVLICFMLGVLSPAQQIWLISTTFQHIVPTQLVWCLDPNNMRISSNTQIMLRCLNIVTSPLLPHNWLSPITISPGSWDVLAATDCGRGTVETRRRHSPYSSTIRDCLVRKYCFVWGTTQVSPILFTNIYQLLTGLEKFKTSLKTVVSTANWLMIIQSK